MAIENHIHVPSAYFQEAAAAGLRLVDFRERFITNAWVAEQPSYAKLLGWPITFLLVFE